jgi:hypothetical protein
MSVGFDRNRKRTVKCGSVILVGLCALLIAVTAQPTGKAGAAPYDPPPPRWQLTVDVDKPLRVAKTSLVRAIGVASPRVRLWLFVAPLGEGCPPSPSAQPVDAAVLATGLPVEGDFEVDAAYRPRDFGRRSFCGYLGPSGDVVYAFSGVERGVRRPLLRARVARRMIRVALRRHGLGKRVVESLQERCRRRERSEFSCRFSSEFPGYKLTGRGRVWIDDEISYHFRVRAQGVRFTLTDTNERSSS